MSPLGWAMIAANFIWLAFLTIVFLKGRSQPKTVPNLSDHNSQFSLGLVKFNPFSDTGGEQSFVVSLLDRQNSGILITSLHGRGTTRLYAKQVSAGKCDQELSVEEKQALSEASSKFHHE